MSTKKTDIVSRTTSIIAVIISALALLQSHRALAPRVSLYDIQVYKKDFTTTGNLDFGVKFLFQNRGGSQLQGLRLTAIGLDDNGVVGQLKTDLTNELFPQDIFNYCATLLIPPSYFDLADQNAVQFRKNIYFHLTVSYPRWYGHATQTFTVLWNKDTHRFEHCDSRQTARIKTLLQEEERTSNHTSLKEREGSQREYVRGRIEYVRGRKSTLGVEYVRGRISIYNN
jgi:hypothetical protein